MSAVETWSWRLYVKQYVLSSSAGWRTMLSDSEYHLKLRAPVRREYQSTCIASEEKKGHCQEFNDQGFRQACQVSWPRDGGNFSGSLEFKLDLLTLDSFVLGQTTEHFAKNDKGLEAFLEARSASSLVFR